MAKKLKAPTASQLQKAAKILATGVILAPDCGVAGRMIDFAVKGMRRGLWITSAAAEDAVKEKFARQNVEGEYDALIAAILALIEAIGEMKDE